MLCTTPRVEMLIPAATSPSPASGLPAFLWQPDWLSPIPLPTCMGSKDEAYAVCTVLVEDTWGQASAHVPSLSHSSPEL